MHAQELRRAQALLWFDNGESMSEMTACLRVTRQTIYNWVHRLQWRREADLPGRLGVDPRMAVPGPHTASLVR